MGIFFFEPVPANARPGHMPRLDPQVSVLLLGGQHPVLCFWDPLPAVIRNLSWREVFIFLQGCFWATATGIRFTHLASRAHEKGSLIHVFFFFFLPPYQLGQFVFPSDSRIQNFRARKGLPCCFLEVTNHKAHSYQQRIITFQREEYL